MTSVTDNGLNSQATKQPERKRELRPHLVIDTESFKKAVKNNEVYVVDVRRKDEVDAGRIMAKRWVHVPLQEFVEALELSEEAFEEKYGASKPRKDAKDVILQCRSGVRSTTALYSAIDRGYSNIRHYADGWIVWKEQTDL